MSLMNTSPNSDYVVISNNEAASIISKFSVEMIEDIIDQALETKLRSYSPRLLNVVDAMELTYKADMANYPDLANQINQERTKLYIYIMSKVLNAHNLGLLVDINSYPDVYSITSIVYDFLIANFNANVVSFFSNYIVKEQDTIYEALSMLEKKNMTLAKPNKNAKNSKLANIYANLDTVLQNICSWDIDLQAFITYAYMGNVEYSKAIISVLADRGKFFSQFVNGFVQQNYAVISTNIKFAMREQIANDIDLV